MIKVSVMYPNVEGSKFDIDYYCKSHISLVRAKLGDALQGVEVEKGISDAAGKPPAYIAFGHLYFESIDTFRSAFGAHGAAFQQDVANYTDIVPILQVSEVML